MTHWYVKDLSKLTGVTVQTLHHYDQIGLLTPSLRGANVILLQFSGQVEVRRSLPMITIKPFLGKQ